MVTGIVQKWVQGEVIGDVHKAVLELNGLSTDAKPTSMAIAGYSSVTIANGSTFFEMNTSKAYMYNETGSAWVEL